MTLGGARNEKDVPEAPLIDTLVEDTSSLWCRRTWKRIS